MGVNRNFIWEGLATFNEDGGDYDFRVESDNNSNMIKVDAGEDAVGIGVAPAANYRTLTIADGLDSAMHINGENAGIYLGTSYTGGFTNNAAIARARVAGYHIQNSQVGDLCIAPERQGDILFGGTDSASGSNNDYVRLAAGGTFNVYRHAVFNENSGDYDFRVESNSDTHAIYLDAGADSGAGRIGFGVSAPEQFVHQANDTGRRLGYVNEWSGGIADIANGATRTITLSNLGNYSAAMVEIWVVWRVSGGSEPAASRILYTFYESANNLHDITVMEFSGKNIVQSDWSTTAGYNQITFNIENTQWAGSTSSWTAGTYHVKAFGSPSIASVIVG
jgi:hypothetical protein